MPASGKAITGKKGTISLENITGATPAFTLAAEVQDYKASEGADEVTGSRLSGADFTETDDPIWSGEFILYASKSDTGVAMPFKTGDHIKMTANFGGNTLVGNICILGRGDISVAKKNFVTCPVKWKQDDDAFVATIKVISTA